jgi:hypothetical protein
MEPAMTTDVNADVNATRNETREAPDRPDRRDPRMLLRQQALRGSIASVGAPVENDDNDADDNGIGNMGIGNLRSAPAAPVPGVFTGMYSSPAPKTEVPKAPEVVAPAQPAAPARLSVSDRLRAMSMEPGLGDLGDAKRARKQMSAMKTLTRLLEAVFTRPGSIASDAERMHALKTLSTRAMDLGSVVARVAGDDADRSQYIRAMSMDAAVSLVCKSWEQGREINWETLIEAADNTPEVSQAAEMLSHAVYSPVVTRQDAADRLAISMHAAFWQVYSLGDTVNGITPRVAAEAIRDCANYLQARDKFVSDNDLHVSWMQSSVRRMVDLFCAEMKARFSNAEAPTAGDIEAVLSVVRSGFEGVENYAQNILEKPRHTPGAHPVDN